MKSANGTLLQQIQVPHLCEKVINLSLPALCEGKHFSLCTPCSDVALYHSFPQENILNEIDEEGTLFAAPDLSEVRFLKPPS